MSPGTVADLLDEAVIERIVFDGPSRVINVGRQRRFTGALRRAIEARDRFCTGPGCDVPAADSEIDHIQPHGHNGRTDQINGDPKCNFHHPLRHRQEAEDAKAPPTRPRTTRWWETPRPGIGARPPNRPPP